MQNGDCKVCKRSFEKTSFSQKTCSPQCRLIAKNKAANEKWMVKDTSENDEKRRIRNIKGQNYIATQHLKYPEWTGKQYKAVRG